jgi:signal transduction histidine kinase
MNSRLLRELQERNKELRCVYGISKICDIPGAPLDAVVQRIVDLLPASWQHPRLACARIFLRGGEFKTRNFTRVRCRQEARITVRGRPAGSLEVGYIRKPARGDRRPFLKAERKLLDAVAERLGKIVELKDAEQELRASHERLRSLLLSVENAREDERRRIAHELHDELGHALMSLKIDLGSLREERPGAGAFLEKTRTMSAFIDTTTHNLQRIAWELRPVLLDEFGLPAAISTLAQEFEKRYGIRCRVRMPADSGGLGPSLALALYRIIQELLTNVARHAMASRVMVKLEKRGAGLMLNVQDDGRGISPGELPGKKTLGLAGIRERVHGLGGELRIQGRPKRGTVATISLPSALGREGG